MVTNLSTRYQPGTDTVLCVASYKVRMPSVKRIVTVSCEVTVLSVTIVAVWILMFIPLILYFVLVTDLARL